ncbi:MAG: WhiB family transcriptional regulator [Micropruina sp.]|nr:WhiB family transcriptional regulator [Micropruina sp.]
MEMDSWPLLAKCRGLQDDMFPDGADQKRARTICLGCQVRAECLAEALDNRIEWGVWGGMTERERRRLLRQHADITSWRQILLEASK